MAELSSPLIVIVGPTAVGKTALAIEVAGRLNGEIISADSRLFYRGMDIGTAKPSLAERRGIPHHLIDVVDPDETFSLAVFQREVDQVVRRDPQAGQAAAAGRRHRAVCHGGGRGLADTRSQTGPGITGGAAGLGGGDWRGRAA